MSRRNVITFLGLAGAAAIFIGCQWPYKTEDDPISADAASVNLIQNPISSLPGAMEAAGTDTMS
jgi:hypothetical protein